MINPQNIYETMKKLVAVPGVSGTAGEKETAFALAALLREQPYFQAHPENVRLVPLEDDPLERSLVTAFLELAPGVGDTVILTGHYDVVDVEEFGPLRDVAFDVEAVTARMAELPLDAESRRDWESGQWLFGRGTADMKFGLALCLELLRHYAQAGGLRGNLLFVAVCGEETNSEGMLRAVSFFRDMAAEKGLVYKALLLAECFEADGGDNHGDEHGAAGGNDVRHAHEAGGDSDADCRYIHYGASGKIMPMFFAVGDATHAGAPFQGFDPLAPSVEIYKRLHLQTDFCQQKRGETTPPPVCLKLQDLKTTYSASTPLYAVSYYSMVTVDLHPQEVMEKLRTLAEEAMEAAIQTMEQRAAAFARRTRTPSTEAMPEEPVQLSTGRSYVPCVMTFRELLEAVQKAVQGTGTGDLAQELADYARSLQARKLSIQDIAIQVVKHLYEMYPDKRPMVILSLIPPYYPDVYMDREDPAAAALLAACHDVMAYAQEAYGQTLRMKDYYMGLSDMSYTGLDANQSYQALLENIVGAGSVYRFPLEDLAQFRVPGVVLGGYGKDFHKHTERLHKSYNFQVLPALYVRLIDDLLG